MDWRADDIREWRGRLRWTQVRAAEALAYHVEAYKKLEAGTRSIAPRVRKLYTTTLAEHPKGPGSTTCTARSLTRLPSPGWPADIATDEALARLLALSHARPR